jgi:hypothetical protein
MLRIFYMAIPEFAVEIVSLFLYIIVFYLAYKIKRLDFLIYSTVFAFVLESLGILLFAGTGSEYFYTSDFLVYFFGVPLFVVLAWGVLFLGAYLVSLKLRMSKISRVFFVPLFVTLVDFVIEVVGVNLGYWVWAGAEGGVGLFSSIVASNFVGWLGVSFGFILCYEYLERRWLSMFLGYFALLFLAFVFESINWIFGFSGGEGYITLGIILFGFFYFWVYFYHRNKILKKDEGELRVNFGYAKYVVYMRVFFYLFALFYFFWNRYYLDWVYDAVLFFVFLIEGYFFLRFKGIVRKQV